MFASQHHAATMLVVEQKVVMQFVNAFTIITEIHMKDVAQSVLEIQIVQ